MILLFLYFVSVHGNTIGGSLKDLTSCTRFHFEEKVLEKVIRNEVIVEMIQVTMTKWEKRIDEKLKEIDDKTDKVMTVIENRIDEKLREIDDHTKKKFTEYEMRVSDMLTQIVDTTKTKMTKFEADVDETFNNIDNKTETKMIEYEANINEKLKLMDKVLQKDIPLALERQQSDVSSLIGNFTVSCDNISHSMMNKQDSALKEYEWKFTMMKAQFNETQKRLNTLVIRVQNDSKRQQKTAMDIFRDFSGNSSLLLTKLTEEQNEMKEKLTLYIDDITSGKNKGPVKNLTIDSTTTNVSLDTTIITTDAAIQSTDVTTKSTELPTSFPQDASSKHGHMGIEFAIMFLKNYVGSHSVNLTIITTEITSVTIYSPYPGVNQSFTTNGTMSIHRIALPSDIDHITSGKINRAVYVRSSKPITVVGESHVYCCSGYAFNAIPLKLLGQHYKVVTPMIKKWSTKNFGIVSIHQNTNVVFTSKSNVGISINGQTLHKNQNTPFVLNQMESYYFSSQEQIELEITGNYEFALFQGFQRYYAYDSDSVAESIPAVERWGKRFIVPLIQATRIIINIVTLSTTTRVNITGIHYSKEFFNTSFIDLTLNAEPYVISSNQPILVSILTTSKHSSINPFMTIVPAISQFSKNYVVAASSYKAGHFNTYEMYLSVIIRKSKALGLRLNGKPISALQESTIASDVDTYKLMIIQLEHTDAQKLSHLESDVYYGLIVYGYSSYEAFAYPAGLRL